MKTQEIIRQLKNPSVLSEASLLQTEQMVKDYPWFPAAWVIYAKNLKITGHPGYPQVLNKAALMSADRKWLKNLMEGTGWAGKNIRTTEEYHLQDFPDEAAGTEAVVKSDKSRLIESFLENGARFKTFSEDEPEVLPVDLAEKAVSLNDEIVTENFVNILVRQKKFTEALEAFQKLSLKYPEKSIYFAARIEEVKDLMNVNN